MKDLLLQTSKKFTAQNTYHTGSDRPTCQEDTCTYRNSGDKYHRADTGLTYKDQSLQPNINAK